MSKGFRILSLCILVWLLAGCTREIPSSVPIANQGSDAGADPTINTLGSETLDLQLQARNDDIQYVDIPGTNERGFIRYIYVFSNVGTTIFDGPVEVIDDKAQVDCNPINTVGNLDDKLDPGEGSLCEGGYMFTQADLDAGKVVSRSRVSVEGGTVTSAEGVTDVLLKQTRALTLTTAADKQTYDQVGQEITITYVILNDGTVTLGPAQFTVSDSLLGAPLNCGAAGTSLPPNGLLNCSATYAITQADLDSGSVIGDATASDGTTISSAAKLLVSKAIGTQPPVSGLTPGTTVQHTVVPGDWLMQIARCYGADYDTVRRANPHIYTPSLIWSGQMVSVPNIGSTGTIYGPPCVVFHTAVLGDTWESIAATYNARLDILKRVNPGGLFTGAKIKVPINSAGGSSSSVPTTKRINFAPGTASATETGTLTTFGEITYLAAASKGQTMTVTLTAPSGEVSMGIYAPNGTTLLNPADPATTWNGTLPVDGDYRIKLASVLGIMDKNYSLKVEITSSDGSTPVTKRISFAPGATSATETGTLTTFGEVTYLAAASMGQTMTVTLTAPPGEVAMGIYDPTGAMLLNPADLATTWNGTLATGGDYRIELASALGIMDKNYSLKVEITSPLGCSSCP